MSQKELQLIPLSSLAKVFPNKIYGKAHRSVRAAYGQEVSFQIAYRHTHSCYKKIYEVKASTSIKRALTLHTVGTVPSTFAAYPLGRSDDNYLTMAPGLFPDPLFPVEDGRVTSTATYWHSLWVTVKLDESIKAGKYPIKIVFRNPANGLEQSVTYTVEVMPYALPAQTLHYAQWFHCDCIADAHHVEVFSEAHWSLMDRYMRLATEHGMNMIFTPLVTPPLDTAVGAERPTVQLVKVTKTATGYELDFSRLERYIKMALAAGFYDFEIGHLFTQWGATACPKVIATVDGEEKRIFGWDTAAAGEEYKSFLGQLVPAVIEKFASLGIARDRLWFHVSDEPSIEHLEQYHKVSAIIKPLIEGCHHFDALSKLEFYTNGSVETPIPGTNHIEPFLDAKVPNLWCYYCCSQCVDVSNRFFSMPSSRNRIIGVQMYKFGIKGFMQWGYNFYYSQYSARKIDPFVVTDADCAFPSGDAFTVYPYRDGAIPSLRQKVFANALEDMRLLTLLEKKIGRERVIEAIDRIAGMDVTFKQYPKHDGYFDELYGFIFDELNK